MIYIFIQKPKICLLKFLEGRNFGFSTYNNMLGRRNKTRWPRLKAQTTVGSRITVAGRLEIYDGSTLRIQVRLTTSQLHVERIWLLLFHPKWQQNKVWQCLRFSRNGLDNERLQSALKLLNFCDKTSMEFSNKYFYSDITDLCWIMYDRFMTS